LTNLGLPLFFLTESSKWFWDLFKPLQVIQFPWRLLSLFSFSSAAVVAFLFKKLEGSPSIYSFIRLFVYSFILFIFSFPFLFPKSFFNYAPGYYQTNDDSTTVRNEYTPVYVKEIPSSRPDTPTKHYYPGLRLFVNGIQQSADPGGHNGEMRSSAFGNDSLVRFVWSETPFRALADLISISGFLIILFMFKRGQGL
jgi:hypothetical protein